MTGNVRESKPYVRCVGIGKHASRRICFAHSHSFSFSALQPASAFSSLACLHINCLSISFSFYHIQRVQIAVYRIIYVTAGV